MSSCCQIQIKPDYPVVEGKAFNGPSNSNFFYEILDYEFERAARCKNAVTLMFIKLDQLGEIGRNYGEAAATRIVLEIEQLIQANIRSSDRGFVYGQDEFMIILPDTPKERAHQIISKLKGLIENYPLANGRGGHVTVAPQFGIASYPHDIRNQ